MDWQTVASIISVVFSAAALVTAVVANRHARRSAEASQRAAETAAGAHDLERGRHHRERTPHLQARWVGSLSDADGSPGVAIVLDPPGAYDSSQVTLLAGPDVDAPLTSIGPPKGPPGIPAGVPVDVGPVALGDRVLITADPARHPGGILGGTCQLRIDLQADGEVWQVLVEVQIPPNPWIY